MTSSETSPSRLPAYGLVVVLAVFAWHVARTNFLIDDAYISFRFARNWSETGVPLFNIGQEPVEGYSNFLWTIFLRYCYALGLNLEIVSRVASVACGALLVVLVHRHLARLGLRPLSVFLGTLALVAFPPFATWCTGGLEGALYALLLWGALSLLQRTDASQLWSGLAAGACGVGLSLVRVDGIFWVAVVAGISVVSQFAAGNRRFARVGLFLGLSALGFSTFLLWRHSVYGEWMANTAHAKAGFSMDSVLRGLRYTASFGVLFVTPLLALLAIPVLLRGERRAEALAAGGMFTAILGYNMAVGGDWMPMFRFLAPASPFIVVLLALLLDRLSGRRALTLAVLAIAVQLLPVFGKSVAPRSLLVGLYFRTFDIGYETEWERWNHGNENRVKYTRVGHALAQVAEPDDSITLAAIGAIGYFSGITIHDCNGLVDREVARREVKMGVGTAGHEKAVPRSWFLPRNPTIFYARLWTPTAGIPIFPAMKHTKRVLNSSWVKRLGFEESHLELMLPVAYPLEQEGIFPPGSVLILLEATDDRQAALEFWEEVPVAEPPAE